MRSCVMQGACVALVCVVGCGIGPKSPDEAALHVTTLSVPVGGIVAAQAEGVVQAPFERAAARIVAWNDLTGAQAGTVCAHTIEVDEDPVPKLNDALAKAGMSGGEFAAALAAWRQGTPERFREAFVMLGEAGKHVPAGVGVSAEGRVTAWGVVAFKSGSRTILALADIRRGASIAAAWLVEIHFHVSGEYVAGINVYHMTAGEPPVLTVQVYSWVRQVEGFFGAIARGLAERELCAQVASTWREVAAYLAK